jgi:hypothetical protein
MALQLIYQMFSKLLGWMVLRGSSDMTKEIEILVLRHQPAVLRRRPPRPRMNGTDRALIARPHPTAAGAPSPRPAHKPRRGVPDRPPRSRPTGDLHRGPRHSARAQDRARGFDGYKGDVAVELEPCVEIAVDPLTRLLTQPTTSRASGWYSGTVSSPRRSPLTSLSARCAEQPVDLTQFWHDDDRGWLTGQHFVEVGERES